MPDYIKMYAILFNAATDALRAIDENDTEKARRLLITAQQRAEELYISGENEAGGEI